MIVQLFLLCLSINFAQDLQDAMAPITWTEMSHYVMYSYAAACRTGLNNWTCYWCTNLPIPKVSDISIIESNGVYGTYGYVGASANEILVSFRGSQTIDNWIHDFEFFKTPYPDVPGAYVHYGFYTAYTVIQNFVRSNVRALVNKYPSKPITIAGHSLGAAISAICAIDLVRQGISTPSKMRVFNIGQPRVGNQGFATYYNSHGFPTYRIVNQRDIVPHVPPKILNFYHVAREIWFPNDFIHYRICDASGEDPTCSDSVIDLSTADHVDYLGFYANKGGCCNCGSPGFESNYTIPLM